MNGAIAWFARNSVAANLLMAVIVIGGISALWEIQQKTFPDTEIEIIQIAVPYLGAAPEEVEQGVCVRIEEEVNGIEGVDRLTSSSAEGACGVSAELIHGYPIDRALSEIKNAVDSISTFPVETEKPVVSHLTMERNAMQLALSGNASERALKLHGERIRDEIAALEGVTRVDLMNARDYEVSIEVSEQSLRRHHLTFDDIVRAVRRSSLDMPGGAIKTRAGEILLRSKGQAYTGEDFESLVVMTRPDGTRLLLGEVAAVRDGFEENDRYSDFDGNPSVLIQVFRVGNQKVLELTAKVKEYVKTAALPEGLSLTVWRDDSIYLKDRLDILIKNGRGGFFLVFCVLALFLRLRLAFWVSLGVPISILGGLWMFPVTGMAIDVLTLFAFILILGLLVDDAIVVGENVHTHQENAEDPLEAAIKGTQEVSVPVIFGVLTTIVAFIPMMVAEGMMGMMFGAIGVTVVLCLFFSVVESQLILPAHLGHSLAREARSTPGAINVSWKRLQSRLSGGLVGLARNRYRPALERALHFRYSTAALALVFLLLTVSVLATGRIQFSFFPDIESDFITASVTMPPGTPAEVTALGVESIDAAATHLRRELEEEFGYPIVKHAMASVGGGAGVQGGPPSSRGDTDRANFGEVALELVSGNDRTVTAAQVVNRWRELTPAIPGAEETSFTSTYLSAGAAIDIELASADVAQLERAAADLKEELTLYPGVFDIADSFTDGKEEIRLSIMPSAEALGLTLDDLARQVRQAFYGEEAQRVQRNRDDIRVMVRYPESQRRSLSDLDNLRIRTPAGGEVPFYVVARADMGRGFSTIKRANRKRVIDVTADMDEEVGNANQTVAALRKDFLPGLLSRYPGLSYDLGGEQREQAKTMGSLMRDYAFALVVIYCLLAVPLRSYMQPLIIMAVIPFGLIGAMVGHLLLGLSFSMMSVFGVVALSGVVVNSSLVLVHYINQRREAGLSLETAVRDAGVARFRPIILTTMTTFAGLTPLLLEKSMGAGFLIPMATSLAFGVVFATAISLFLVPCSYVIIEDLAGILRRIRRTPDRAPLESALDGVGGGQLPAGSRPR